MATQSATDLIKAYLEDAIAAEKTFETQLRGFAKEGNDPTVQSMFERHANETRIQYERLTERLKALGGGTSGVKTALAHMLAMLPKTAQLGHDDTERVTQNLMIAYAVENAECAMYEALASIATSAGDAATAQLARSIQQEERQTADLVWKEIPRAAVRPLSTIGTEGTERARRAG